VSQCAPIPILPNRDLEFVQQVQYQLYYQVQYQSASSPTRKNALFGPFLLRLLTKLFGPFSVCSTPDVPGDFQTCEPQTGALLLGKVYEKSGLSNAYMPN